MAVNEEAIYKLGGFNVYHRAGTDDDHYAIPELIEQDMYGMQALAQLEPDFPSAVLDCGAHIGIFSLLAAVRFHQVEIHAFEPQPDNYALLERNAAQFARIQPHAAGVGVENGEMTLYKQGEAGDGFTARWTMVPPVGTALENGVKVRIDDLDEFILALHCPVFLLKLDLEGYEARIIDAISAEALSKIKIIVLEEHHIAVDHRKLFEHGFRVIDYPLHINRHFVYYNTNFTQTYETGSNPPGPQAAAWQKFLGERRALINLLSAELRRYQEVQDQYAQLEQGHQNLQGELDYTKSSLNGQIAELQAWLAAVHASPTYRLGQYLTTNKIAMYFKKSAFGRWLMRKIDSNRKPDRF
jgi:FkbM family methyltransferase